MIKTREHIDPLTHNNFKTYDSCKRKYYYEYIKKLHWPSEESNYELGLSVHKLADYQAKGLETKRFLTNANKDIKEIWEYLQESEIITFPVIESEWAFNVRLGKTPYWLQGRIDRLAQHKNKYLIIDFKTGQNLPYDKNVDWQAITYLYCVSLAKKIKPEDLEFWYYKVAEDPEYREIKYSASLHKEYEDKMLETITQIQSNKAWAPNNNCIDKYCKYTELCMTSKNY